MIGLVPVPEVIVSALCVQFVVETAGNVAEAAPGNASVTAALNVTELLTPLRKYNVEPLKYPSALVSETTTDEGAVVSTITVVLSTETLANKSVAVNVYR